MGSECPYCGNDRGDTYYCAHCSAPKEFIERVAIKLGKKINLNKTLANTLAGEKIVAEKLIEKEAENIIEQTIVAMDAVQETFAEYKKPTTRSSGSKRGPSALGLQISMFVGMILVILVLTAITEPSMFQFSGDPISGDAIPLPIYVNVRVRIVNSTDYSYYTDYADFIGEGGDTRCTYSYTMEQEYKLSNLFYAGERVSFCITKSDSMDGHFPYYFTIPTDWDADSGVYYTRVVVD